MREIVLDTETTGLDPRSDRIVEIGGVELVNAIPTGATFHAYLNPERPMAAEAFAVHGLDDAFLADKPVFAAIAADFLAFVGDARLVIHNAAFDMGFINMEFGRLGLSPIPSERVVDTLALARRKHAGASNSLDALCARYGIDNSRRTKHGALLDSEILAEVYLELLGGRQAALFAGPAGADRDIGPGLAVLRVPARRRPEPLAPKLTEEERAAHLAFVATLGGSAVWKRYLDEEAEAPAAANRAAG